MRGSVLLLSLVLASGCALFGGREPQPRFATVAVEIRGQADTDLEADSTMKSALVGGGAGALSGAVVGGAAGGAAGVGSGPFALIAVPVTAATGAVMGVAAGGTLGAVIGGLQGLPSEKAEQVTEVLANVAQTRDFQEELRSAVEADIPEGRRADPDRAEARAGIHLTQLELEQHTGDEVSLRIRAKMSLEWGPNREDPHSQSFDYEYETPERHVDEWLVDDGASFAASFTEGIETIAGQMSRDILSPEPR
jgi:hypothetical protein